MRRRSKPIRRPQLKKVLKEYCSPIPEEDEEATPPENGAEWKGSAGPANTTVVVVNGGDATPRPSGDGQQLEKSATSANEGEEVLTAERTLSTSDEMKRPVSPISPLT